MKIKNMIKQRSGDVMKEKINEFKQKMNKRKEIISTEDFRQRFCDKCYWHKNNGCDINTVTLDYCCHSQVEKWKYKIKTEEGKKL